MKFIQEMIDRPVTVTVGVILLLLFGLIALFKIPVQLTPEVIKPEITVDTFWRGASPLEIEREIIERQEEQLKAIPGLVEMTSTSRDSRGAIVLSFRTGTDLDSVLLQVSNRLNQVSNFPLEADRPLLRTVNVGSSAIAWFILKTRPGNQKDINTTHDFAEDFIKARLERVPGVAISNVFGGIEREMQVRIDPDRVAAFNITILDLISALKRENTDISAGDFDEGKRRYIVRTLGKYRSPQDIEEVVIKTVEGKRIRVSDVAQVQLGFKKPQRMVRQNGDPAVAVNVLQESGANTLEVMEGLREAVKDLNAGILKDNDLHLNQVYDETDYIVSSIALVKKNLIAGGFLAVLVLILFLRSGSSTLIVATAIPISVIGTFLVLRILGRNLNVVSMAGMAFAVGMVVDVAIVVLENIYRHRQMGKDRNQAVIDGMSEVWGAVLASTLTTIAVFLPIFFIEEQIGQLFRDIAIAISASVSLSLIVAMTVIPTFASRIIDGAAPLEKSGKTGDVHNLFGIVPLAAKASDGIALLVYRICRRPLLAFGVVAGLTLFSVGLAWFLIPKAEYLPEGNRNLVIGILLPPPGYNLEEVRKIGEEIEADLRPYWEKDNLNPKPEDPDGPEITNFFYVASGRQVFMGVRTQDPTRIREMIPIMRKTLRKIPGMIAIVLQSGLFSRGLGEGRSIDVAFSGPDLNKLVGLGRRTFGQLRGLMSQAQIRPVPGLDLGNPEVQVIPDPTRMADMKLSASELGRTIDALLDGTKATDYFEEGERLDLVVKGLDRFDGPIEDLEHLPIRTPTGRIVTLNSLAELVITNGPEQVNHLERERTISIRVVPPIEISLQEAMEVIEEKVLAPMKAQGVLRPPYRVALKGTADDLLVTREAIQWNLILAAVITYLLMSSLFESFFYAFVIMFSVPLAAGGGFLGLWLVNKFITYQTFDILTMLGFIILIGTTVNNAILIIHQALVYIREEGEIAIKAVQRSVRVRIRPIFMSMLTSVFGMLPLVLFTGPGSEIYRGIGSVVIGGLVLSTLFTLFLVPALFSLMLDFGNRLTRSKPAGIHLEEGVVPKG
ncbi:MAG: efflux RND transporter permease subunit [Nitrospira sp.]|nr:efflux RND transporter permease subunit [Candidatus Manganitrophaceae bacterium]HIL34811.1 efflux RND transporter permease subunit [Candidatus Manganitrophaceae bacterium]